MIKRIFSVFIAGLTVTSCASKVSKQRVDLLIVNGTVYDGMSNAPQQKAVAVTGDKISWIGTDVSQIQAAKTIDAKGYIVSPGFIDPHTHADKDLEHQDRKHNAPFLYQGVTSVVVGSDGFHLFPNQKYIDLYKKQGVGTNVVPLIGHGTLRKQVIGTVDRKATKDDLAKMKALMHQEMKTGAFGMSTGLFYAPASYSNTQEVIELAKIVHQYGGIYDTHLRDESSYTVGLKPAVEEAIEIGRQAKLPIHLTHIKCLGVDVWHQSADVIRMVEEANQEGIYVTANQYPYDASATGLRSATVPRWVESGGRDSMFIRYETPELKAKILQQTTKNITRRGGPSKLLFVKTSDSTILGKNLQEVADMYQMSPAEAVYQALRTGYIRVASFNMNTEDIHRFMKQPWVVTGSDGNTGHPRKYGSFPRKYHKYVKTDKVISLPFFINNSTYKTAQILGMKQRGAIAKGYFADIIVFHPDTFNEKATYNDAFQLAEGLEYSIINGNIALQHGKQTDTLYGRVLSK